MSNTFKFTKINLKQITKIQLEVFNIINSL